MNRIRTREIIEVILPGIVLILCAIFRQYQPTSYIAAVVIGFYILYSIFIAGDKLFLKYIILLFSNILFLVGTFLCDNTAVWLGEIGNTTSYAGAFNLLALYYWIFYTFLKIIDPFFQRHTQRGMHEIIISGSSFGTLIYQLAPFIIFLCGSILFLSVASHPFFASGLENRFVYASKYVSRYINVFKIVLPMLSIFLVGPIVNHEKKLDLRYLIVNILVPYLPYLLFLLWTGNRFGDFWQLICCLIIPIFTFLDASKKSRLKIFWVGLLLIIILFALMISYYVLQGVSLKDSMENINLRIACQGELWWKLIAKVDNGSMRLDAIGIEFRNIVDSFKTEGASQTYGTYHLMNILGNSSVVESYKYIFTRFTSTGIEYPFYCIRYLSFVIMPLLICPFFALIMNIFVNAVKEKRMIAAMCSARLMLISLSAIGQGDWYLFSTVTSTIVIVMLVISEITTCSLCRRGMKTIGHDRNMQQSAV